MAEEIVFENGRISYFQELVTLTLDRVMLHTVVHHSSTSTYKPNFIDIKVTYNIRTDAKIVERQVFLWHNQTTHTVQKHISHACFCYFPFLCSNCKQQIINSCGLPHSFSQLQPSYEALLFRLQLQDGVKNRAICHCKFKIFHHTLGPNFLQCGHPQNHR